MTRFLVAMCLLSAFAGCSKKKPSEAAPGSGSGSGAGVTTSVTPTPVTPAGAIDDGVLAVVVWPAQWNQLDAIVGAVRAKLPAEAAVELDKVVAVVKPIAATPSGLLKVAADAAGILTLPAELPGLDPARPIVVSAFAPLDAPEHLLVSLVSGASQPNAVTTGGSVRHRVLLPATDPKALTAALRDAAAKRMKDLGGGTTFGNAEHMLQITSDAGSVSVTIVVGIGLTALDAAARDRAFGGPVSLAQHPLLANAAPSLGRLQLRLDRFAALATRESMRLIAGAIQESTGNKAALLAAGYSELLTAELVLDPSATMVASAIVDVPAVAPHLPAMILVPTESGLAALRADPTLAAGKRAAITDLDVGKMAAVAKASPLVTATKDRSEVATLMHECGWYCTVYLGLGNSLALLGKAKPDEIAENLAESVREIPQLAIVRLSLVGTTLLVEPFGENARGVETARALKAVPDLKPSAAAVCYGKTMIVVREQLKRMGEGEAAVAQAFDRMEAETKANLDCVAKDPVLADRLAKLREAFGRLAPRTPAGP